MGFRNDPYHDTVAEWLRRLTRNELGLSRAGWSPVSVVPSMVYSFCVGFCSGRDHRTHIDLVLMQLSGRNLGQVCPFLSDFVPFCPILHECGAYHASAKIRNKWVLY